MEPGHYEDQYEPLPEKQMTVGKSYLFFGKSESNGECHWFPGGPSFRAVFAGYYHNQVGYCMMRLRDKTLCQSYNPLDIYNPKVRKDTLNEDYGRVSIMDKWYSTIPTVRFEPREKAEIARLSHIVARRSLEKALTGTLTIKGKFDCYLPRELVRLVGDFAYGVPDRVPDGAPD